MKVKRFYRQRLPHIQQVGATFFVTFRLYGSIPKVKLYELKEKYTTAVITLKNIKDKKERNQKLFRLRKEYFANYDRLLDRISAGPTHLSEDSISGIVKKQLHRFDGELYDLICYTIMSNHVHLLISTDVQLNEEMVDMNLLENYVNLDEILKRIKGPSAVYSNRVLGLEGQFWDRENYDVYIRNEKMMDNVISYILNNPVKAGIVETWEKYNGSYYKYED